MAKSAGLPLGRVTLSLIWPSLGWPFQSPGPLGVLMTSGPHSLHTDLLIPSPLKTTCKQFPYTACIPYVTTCCSLNLYYPSYQLFIRSHINIWCYHMLQSKPNSSMSMTYHHNHKSTIPILVPRPLILRRGWRCVIVCMTIPEHPLYHNLFFP